MNSAATIEQMLASPLLRSVEALDMTFVELFEAFDKIKFHARPSEKVLRRGYYDGDSVFVVMDNARTELCRIYYLSDVGLASVGKVFSERERLIDLVRLLVNSWVKVQTALRKYAYPVDLRELDRLLTEAVLLQLQLEHRLTEVHSSSDRLQSHFDCCVTGTSWSLLVGLTDEAKNATMWTDLEEQYNHFKPLAEFRDRLSSRMDETVLVSYLEEAKKAMAGDRWREKTRGAPDKEQLRALERQRLEDELVVDALLNQADEESSDSSLGYCRRLARPLSKIYLSSCNGPIFTAGSIVLSVGEQPIYSA